MATDSSKELPEYHPKDRQQWRNWLQKNHQVHRGVWLIYFKKSTGKRKLSYDEAVEEALCFGWIDSLPRTLDESRSMLKFSPRKPRSVWSASNKKRVAVLIKNGLMQEAGMACIRIAKKNGSWQKLSESDRHAEYNTIPEDLAVAFKTNPQAQVNFEAFTPGYRKQFLSWIDSAKRPETRKARIEQTLKMSAANKKPGVQGFKL